MFSRVAFICLVVFLSWPCKAEPPNWEPCEKGRIPDLAIKECSKLLEIDSPGVKARAYYSLAWTYYKINKYDLALDDLNQAMIQDPSESYVRKVKSLRGRVLYYKNDYDQAISDLTVVVDSGSAGGDTFYYRGLAYQMKNAAEAALADCLRALDKNPKSKRYNVFCGSAYLDMDEFAKALGVYDKAIDVFDKDPYPHYGKARALHYTKDYSGAIAENSLAIKIDDKFALAYAWRGLGYLKNGDRQSARQDFDKVVALGNSDEAMSAAQTGLGLLNIEEQRFDAALSAFDKAIGADWLDPEPLFHKGTALERKGDASGALDSYRKAAVLKPRSFSERQAVRDAQERIASLNGESRPQPVVSPAPSSQETRVALIIGNSDYRATARLDNPQRDAEAISASLRELGFKSVTLKSNLTMDEMRRSLRDFGAEAEKADWAMVYYAGHGIEIGGINYLLPVDAELKTDRDVQFEAIALDQVLNSVSSAKKLRLVVLDACRNNPFVNSMSRTVASRSVGRGLAPVEPEGATLVAYSAKGGQVALDGDDGNNSPFVSALLRHLKEPDIELRWLFSLVRDDVLAATDAKQEPFTYGSLPAQKFIFRPSH